MSMKIRQQELEDKEEESSHQKKTYEEVMNRIIEDEELRISLGDNLMINGNLK